MFLNSAKGVAGNLMSQIQAIIMIAVYVDTSLAFWGNEMLLVSSEMFEHICEVWVLFLVVAIPLSTARERCVLCTFSCKSSSPHSPSLLSVFGAGCLWIV